MFSARLPISICTVALLAASAAHAADYSQPLPPPVYVQPPPVIQEFSSWYLRGDVGIGMMRSNRIEYLENPANNTGFIFDHSSVGDSYFLGGGVGYEFNNWLRFDVTAEYRAKSQVNAFGTYGAPATFLDVYQGNISSWVFLGNAYVDLGTWNCFTPFVGAGIGVTRNTLSDFTDIGTQTGGRGIGRNTSEWHPAWALHAGVAYNVSKNFKVELAYRYLNLGSITDTIDCIGCGLAADSYKFGNLYSHDIKLGLRWTCCDTPAPPPRVYMPPLNSKG